MTKLVLICGALLALSQLGQLNAKPSVDHWTAFKLEHGKSYASDQEEMMRRAIFMLNKHKIDEFNAEQSDELGFTMGLNSRSDLTDEEFAELTTASSCQEVNPKTQNSEEMERFKEELLESGSVNSPSELDWRKFPNRVGSVGDQGEKCASGHTFAALGSLEGQLVLKNISKEFVELSEQFLLDCSFYTCNCEGGTVAESFDDLMRNEAVATRKYYPYTGAAYLKKGDEKELKRTVAIYGPVGTGIFANSTTLRHYKSGIHNNPHCNSLMDPTDHSVLIVGYGTESGKDYWLAKNSWGTSWGENGYVKLMRNKDNQCDIASKAVLPALHA